MCTAISLAKISSPCYDFTCNPSLQVKDTEEGDTMDSDEKLLDANEAVKYLAERWGVESYSLVAFRSLRFRYNIKPALAAKTATFWRKSDLDQIPKPSKSNPRPKRKKAGDDSEDDGTNTSVRFLSFFPKSLSHSAQPALAEVVR